MKNLQRSGWLRTKKNPNERFVFIPKCEGEYYAVLNEFKEIQ